MRLVDFTIEKYGAIEERRIEFGTGPGLILVHGRNEAGKSTTLEAISDFFFGIPGQTARLGVWGYPAIRLAATLEHADGTQLHLARRKGNKATLTSSAGAVVNEATLATLLGGMARSRFEAQFCLDHHRLRAGGEALLSSDGEIGRLIVEAGGGLAGLTKRLEAIDTELDGLFAARRSDSRAFYRVLDVFDAADKAMRAETVTIDQYERAGKAVADAELEETGIAARRKALTMEASRLDRMIRVGPILAGLVGVRDNLSGFSDLPDLPVEFDDQVATARKDLAATGAAFAEAKAGLDDLAAARDRLTDPPLSAETDAAIRSALKRANQIEKAREDRPNRQRDLDVAQAKLAALRTRLGLAADADLPTPDPLVLSDLRKLLNAAIKRTDARRAATGERDRLDTMMATLAARIAMLVSRGLDRPLSVDAKTIAALPERARTLALEATAIEKAAAKCESAAGRLGFASVAALSAARVPDAARLAKDEAFADKLAADQRRFVEARVAAEGRRGKASADIGRLSGAAPLVSASDVATARAHRDATLEPMRAALLAGRSDLSDGARIAAVSAADRSVTDADDAVDRRLADTARAASLDEALRQLDLAESEMAALDRALAALLADETSWRAALTTAFPDAMARPDGLAGLRQLTEGRDRVLAAWRELDARRDRLTADKAGFDGLVDLLRVAESRFDLTPGDLPLAERVGLLTEAQAARVGEQRDLARDREDLGKAEAARTGLLHTLSTLDEADREEAPKRAALLSTAGLDASMPLQDAADAVQEWTEAGGALASLQGARDRLAGMDRDEEALRRDVQAAGEVAGVVLPADPVAAAEKLEEVRKARETMASRRQDLSVQIADAEKAMARAASALDASRARLATLAARAGLSADDAAALTACVARHVEREKARKRERELAGTLAASGDGEREADLMAALAGRDADALRAERKAVEDQQAALDGTWKAALETLHTAATAFKALANPDRHRSTAGAAREAAAADLSRVGARWLELGVARDLLSLAIDRVRQRQQDPLIARAGALFAAMTGGDHRGIATGIDAEDGKPVISALSPDGQGIAVSRMSDGTRDQLFLAFRLAGIEAYARAAEPLPFIGDDILVHFDDRRTANTLAVLADLSAATQVLLFTHHDSVREAVRPFVADGRARIVDL
jgi:uncharacterized protein YhaN